MRVFVMKKVTLIRLAALLLVIAAIFTYAKIASGDDAPAFSQNGVITAGSKQEKAVAITIDTSFGEEDHTLELLDVLEKHGACATFAVMGAWAREHEDLVHEIADRGHEVISHSMAHEKYNDLGKDGAVADALANREYLAMDYGIRTDLIRLPYGSGSEEICEALEQNGLRVVGWSLDSADWKGEDAETVSERVLGKLKQGDIVLFQNNTAAAPEALDRVLEKLGERVYRTVTVSGMIECMSMSQDAGETSLE